MIDILLFPDLDLEELMELMDSDQDLMEMDEFSIEVTDTEQLETIKNNIIE
tara:strand:- start:1699 stop:1851 length:153 start_codon:yes stop_codon:yes gene_type:complete